MQPPRAMCWRPWDLLKRNRVLSKGVNLFLLSVFSVAVLEGCTGYPPQSTMAWFAPGKNMPCDYVDMQTLMDVHYLIKKYQNQRIYKYTSLSVCIHLHSNIAFGSQPAPPREKKRLRGQQGTRKRLVTPLVEKGLGVCGMCLTGLAVCRCWCHLGVPQVVF